MSDVRTNGVSITVPSTKEQYHSLKSWGLAIGNNNCIGDPKQETTYVNIPGSSGFLDMSEAVSGRPVFTHREITIEFGGIRGRTHWDGVISDFRNRIEGRVVRVIFDNDKAHYYEGRAYIIDFDRVRELGTFTLSIPMAQPYKYEARGVNDPWLWDPFSFTSGVITYIGKLTVSGSKSIRIPRGYMDAVPTFTVSDAPRRLTLKYKGQTFALANGENRFPQILLGGNEEITLELRGSGTVTVEYRRGSL